MSLPSVYLYPGPVPTQAAQTPLVTVRRSASAHQLPGPAELNRFAAAQHLSEGASPQVSRLPSTLPVIPPTTPARGHLVSAPSIVSIDLGRNSSRYAESTPAAPNVDTAILRRRKISEAQDNLKNLEQEWMALDAHLPPHLNIDQVVDKAQRDYEKIEMAYQNIRSRRRVFFNSVPCFASEATEIKRKIEQESRIVIWGNNHYGLSPDHDISMASHQAAMRIESLRCKLEHVNFLSDCSSRDFNQLAEKENRYEIVVSSFFEIYESALNLRDEFDACEENIKKVKNTLNAI
jgi:hypothetical protein